MIRWKLTSVAKQHVRCLHYIQGQEPSPTIREYFYYIDHQGQLFLDDTKVKNFITCFKEKKFLVFFFRQLKKNNTTRYVEHFPYISLCGVERNFIRCDDRPIVYSHIVEKPSPDNPEETHDVLSYEGTAEALTVKFEPEKLCMLPQSGRVYHPAKLKVGGVGLIKSSLAIEISKHFEFGLAGEYAPPTHFHWKGKRYTLSNELWKLMTDEERKELANV
uniref:UPF0598 protein C8orf82 homolog n=1 Tax=Saccoglossus kowalevskii TaxID=10224 RepID=A0ABM0GQL3_SACKO|nr:PREDICTED: UPF0598 protein C8orf82 homolog [Saccoglossus kowalevskii]